MQYPRMGGSGAHDVRIMKPATTTHKVRVRFITISRSFSGNSSTDYCSKLNRSSSQEPPGQIAFRGTFTLSITLAILLGIHTGDTECRGR